MSCASAARVPCAVCLPPSPGSSLTARSDESIETDPSPEVVAQLAQEMTMHDVLLLLVARIGVFEFEVRLLSL